jgi:CSLREA domain-containing protein
VWSAGAAALVLATCGAGLASAPSGASAPRVSPHAVAHHDTATFVSPRTEGPRLAKPRATAPFRTYVVNTTADAPLLSSGSISCVDNQITAHCSLRAAVEAANNLNRPALIELSAGTYYLTDTSDGSLEVDNAGGTTITGKGPTLTRIDSELGYAHSAVTVNTSANSGGSSLQMSGLSISGGDAVEGGGIYIDGSSLSLVLDNVHVSGNSAVDGGGMYCAYASVWATNTVFSANTAAGVSGTSAGGGIDTYWCDVYFTSDTIDNNIAGSASYPGYGGGMYNDYGTVELTDSVVNSNTAGNVSQYGEGGGLFDTDGTVEMTNSQLSHDTAYGEGGGTYEEESHLIMTNTLAEYDSAIDGSSGCGGAIYVEYAANVNLTRATLSHDTTTAGTSSGDGGGAIYDSGYSYGDQLTIASSTISSDNTSAIVLYGYYGGLDAQITGTLFQGDTTSAENYGGAITDYAEGYVGDNLALSGDTFTHDVGTGEYGAGAISTYVDYYGGGDVEMSHCTLSDNTATGEYGSGGVIQYADEYAGSSMSITYSSLTGNKSTYVSYGGAVGSWGEDDDSSVQLVMDHDTVSGNQAGATGTDEDSYGGGILAYDYTQITVTNSTITNNVSTAASGYEGYGGGIYDASYMGSHYANDVISGNRATGSSGEGGGLYLYPYDGGASVVNSTISGNRADNGAGIYAYAYTLLVKGSTISGNTAGGAGSPGYGGGIYDEEVSLDLINSTISGNAALNGTSIIGEGGGIYNYADGAPLTLYFTTVDANAAAKGAGVFTTIDSGGTVRDSIVAGNTTVLKGKVAADCYNYSTEYSLQSAGGNVLGKSTCVDALNTGDVASVAAGVLPLANNGGTTETMALSPKSPAVGLAKGDCLATDQRGVARKAGHCDAGAYQLVVKGKPV